MHKDRASLYSFATLRYEESGLDAIWWRSNVKSFSSSRTNWFAHKFSPYNVIFRNSKFEIAFVGLIVYVFLCIIYLSTIQAAQEHGNENDRR